MAKNWYHLGFSKVFEVSCDVSCIRICESSSKKVSMWLTSVRRRMTLVSDTLPMIRSFTWWLRVSDTLPMKRSFTRWFNHYVINNTTSFCKSFWFILAIRPSDILTPKRSWMHDMIVGLSFSKTKHSWDDIKRESRTKLRCAQSTCLCHLKDDHHSYRVLKRWKNKYESCPDFCDVFALLKDGTTHDVASYILEDGYFSLYWRLCSLEFSLIIYCLKITW